MESGKSDWLVVSTHLKNISQTGNLPQIGVDIKNIWNHHLDDAMTFPNFVSRLLGNPDFQETF